VPLVPSDALSAPCRSHLSSDSDVPGCVPLINGVEAKSSDWACRRDVEALQVVREFLDEDVIDAPARFTPDD
jgi:hypothetical protein